MTTTEQAFIFLPDNKVEWLDVVSDTTSINRIGWVLPRDSDLITDEERARADQGEIIPVRDGIGGIYLVERSLLAPYGWREKLRRQSGIDYAMARVRAVQHALDEARTAVMFIVGFEDPEDGTDADCAIENAEANLRDVSRILRLNGARS